MAKIILEMDGVRYRLTEASYGICDNNCDISEYCWDHCPNFPCYSLSGKHNMVFKREKQNETKNIIRKGK